MSDELTSLIHAIGTKAREAARLLAVIPSATKDAAKSQNIRLHQIAVVTKIPL